jgi:hypothetical protein
MPKSSKVTKSSKGKVEEKPKRAPSPYIIFCSEKRPEVKAANPETSFGEMGKILGAMWAQLDEKGKAVSLLHGI